MAEQPASAGAPPQGDGGLWQPAAPTSSDPLPPHPIKSVGLDRQVAAPPAEGRQAATNVAEMMSLPLLSSRRLAGAAPAPQDTLPNTGHHQRYGDPEDRQNRRADHGHQSSKSRQTIKHHQGPAPSELRGGPPSHQGSRRWGPQAKSDITFGISEQRQFDSPRNIHSSSAANSSKRQTDVQNFTAATRRTLPPPDDGSQYESSASNVHSAMDDVVSAVGSVSMPPAANAIPRGAVYSHRERATAAGSGAGVAIAGRHGSGDWHRQQGQHASRAADVRTAEESTEGRNSTRDTSSSSSASADCLFVSEDPKVASGREILPPTRNEVAPAVADLTHATDIKDVRIAEASRRAKTASGAPRSTDVEAAGGGEMQL